MVLSSSSFSQLFGPAVSGWTYGLWPAYPAAIPSMIGTVYALLGLALCTLWLPSGIGIYQGDVNSTPSTPSKTKAARASACRLLLTWPMPLVLGLRIVHGFMTMGLMELGPLWLISTQPLGGLGLSEEQVGTFLARSAVWNILYFSVLMPRVSKRTGVRCFGALASATAGICCLVLPAMSNVAIANTIHMMSTTTSISTGAVAMIWTNNVVIPARRSEIQGIVVIFETLAKAAGPVFTANVFAWTLSAWGREGHSVVFHFLAGLHALYLVGAACLPASVENPSDEQVTNSSESQVIKPIVVGASATVPDEIAAGDGASLLPRGLTSFCSTSSDCCKAGSKFQDSSEQPQSETSDAFGLMEPTAETQVLNSCAAIGAV